MGVVGKGRLRYAVAAVSFGVFALAVVSAATARPAAKKPAPVVAKATCGTLTLKKGGSGLLRVKAGKGSLPVVSASLAPGTKTKTKVRTISPSGKTAFRYTLAKKAGQAEKVRVVVLLKKGKASKRLTVVCAVRIGSNAAILNVAMDGGGEGTVTFAPGGTTCSSEKAPCAKSYAPGKKVKLTASPGTNSTFEGWSGACKGKATCSVKAAGVKTATAKFVKKSFEVTIEKGGEGDGTISSDGPLACGATCSSSFPAGTIVRLKAEPDGNSRFVGWTGECTSTVTTCNFPVDGEITVTATFAKKGNRLNVSRAGATGGGNIEADVPGVDCGDTCSWTYPAGTVVTLSASAQPGYLFAAWRGDCAGTNGTTCTVTMDAAKFIAAEFQKGVPVTVQLGGTTPGTVTSSIAGITCGSTCTALFFPNKVVTLTAAGPGFVRWDNCPAEHGNECDLATDPAAPPGTITAVYN